MGKDYGEKIPYDPLWKGPMEISRRKTDPGAFKFFLIFILIWLGIGLYVIYALDGSGKSRNKRESNLNELFGQTHYDPIIHSENESPEDIVSIKNKKSIIFGCTVLAGILSVIYITMMRWWAKVMAYTIIFFIWICMFVLIISIMHTKSTSETNDQAATNFSLGFLIIMLVVSIILVVIFRKKIAIACAMIQEAAKTALFFPSHFLIPVALCPLLLAAFVFSLMIFYSLKNYEEKRESNGSGVSLFSGILHFYNVCAFLWLWNFISGTKHMIFSSSFATWYWTMNKKYVPGNTVRNSLQTVSKYHLGTVAFGSLIVTICEIIKALLRSATRGARENSDAAVQTIMACFSCCCESITDIIEYVNRNAYVMSAIHGTDFLTSAKNAFNLIMRNVGKVLVTLEITSLLFGVGVLVSCAIPATISYFSINDTTAAGKDAKMLMVVVVFILSLFLSSALFTILQSAVETIFICAIEDYERNDGSEERPYYMNYKLRNLMLNE